MLRASPAPSPKATQSRRNSTDAQTAWRACPLLAGMETSTREQSMAMPTEKITVRKLASLFAHSKKEENTTHVAQPGPEEKNIKHVFERKIFRIVRIQRRGLLAKVRRFGGLPPNAPQAIVWVVRLPGGKQTPI